MNFGATIEGARRARKPMTLEAEVEAVAKAHAGDRAAANDLVLSNLGVIAKTIQPYVVIGAVSAEDVFQMGVEGFLHGVQKFDASRGIRLCSYCVWWIRAYAQRGVFKDSRMVRRQIKGTNRVEFAPVVSDERAYTTAPALDDNPEQHLARKSRAAHIRRVLERRKLDARQRDIIVRRLMADVPASMDDLGETHGCSRERIRQIEAELREWLTWALADVREAA